MVVWYHTISSGDKQLVKLDSVMPHMTDTKLKQRNLERKNGEIQATVKLDDGIMPHLD